jgi:DNA-binding transcriptional LysR family regulator
MADILTTNANLLVALDLLISERSVSRAAKRFGVTQSSMSGILAQLRGVFDDPLLVRAGNQMQPTPRAEAIAAKVRHGVEAFAAALAEPSVFDPRTSEHRFVIGASDYAGFVLFPRLMRRVAERAPRVSVQMLPWAKVGVPPELARGEVDLSIGFPGTERVPGGHFKRKLFSDRFVCIARKGHPKIGARLTLDTYTSLDHAIVTETRDADGVVDEALRKLRRSRRTALRVPHFLLVPAIIAETDLVAAMDERVVSHFARSLPIQVLEPPLKLPTGSIHMMWHARTHDDPAQKWLRSLVADVAKESNPKESSGRS